jgi:UPF0755 protein
MRDLHDRELADVDDAEYEELRPELSGRRKLLVVLAGIITVIALLVGSVAFWAHRQLHPSGRPGDEVQVDVPSGSSTNAIADLLEKKGVISSAIVFKLWLSLKSAGPFNAGEYQLHKNADADVVLDALRRGPLPPPAKRFTVPPGLNKREIPDQVIRSLPALSIDEVRRVIADGTVRSQALPDIADLEGLLFPDTYEIAQGADEKAVVQVMVAEFDKVAAQIGLAEAPNTVGVDPYEAIVVASLIEEEAKVDEDRSKIARVIYNRLKQGIPLGVDATLCYLKDERPCVLRQSELSAPGPYNTRLVRGLPPTPIASPGKASLEAALNPEEGDWIFYVLDPELDANGTRHLFTSSAAEFERAKARCKAANLGCG